MLMRGSRLGAGGGGGEESKKEKPENLDFQRLTSLQNYELLLVS